MKMILEKNVFGKKSRKVKLVMKSTVVFTFRQPPAPAPALYGTEEKYGGFGTLQNFKPHSFILEYNNTN